MSELAHNPDSILPLAIAADLQDHLLIACNDLDRLQELAHHLQHLGVDHELLVGGDEPAFHPAGAVHHHVGVAHHRTPQGHLRFIGRLGVDRVGGL